MRSPDWDSTAIFLAWDDWGGFYDHVVPPVVDRNGRVIASAITSLDLHDLARSSRTYGVRALYVVHPVPEQREFARSVIEHWRIGYGRSFDSRRVEALNLIEIVADLDVAVAAAERVAGRRPFFRPTPPPD